MTHILPYHFHMTRLDSAQSVRLGDLFENNSNSNNNNNNNNNGGLSATSDPYHHDRSKTPQYAISSLQSQSQSQQLRPSSGSLDINHQSNHQSNPQQLHDNMLPHGNGTTHTNNNTNNFLSAVSSDDSWDETHTTHPLNRHPLHHNPQTINSRMDYNALLAEFSSRVIVASDAAGFLRVYVRSGGFNCNNSNNNNNNNNNSRNTAQYVVNRDNGELVDDFETSL